MSRRQVIKKYQLLDQADTTTNPESTHTDVQQVDFVTYELGLDATVTALLSVQYCNDERIDASSVFKDLDFSQTLTLDGSVDTDGIVHVENKGFKFLKLSITNNGGTGNVDAWITGLTRGA